MFPAIRFAKATTCAEKFPDKMFVAIKFPRVMHMQKGFQI